MERLYNEKVRVHPTRTMYGGDHIDTTIVTLGFNKKAQRNILLVNPESCNSRNIPAIFRGKNWAVLNAAPMVDKGFEPGFELASEHVGMNILVLRPDLVLIDDG